MIEQNMRMRDEIVRIVVQAQLQMVITTGLTVSGVEVVV
jgi:hypothetical protein